MYKNAEEATASETGSLALNGYAAHPAPDTGRACPKSGSLFTQIPTRHTVSL